ncbi:MAG: AsmA family protein, partial [Pseudomonadota bacterium]
MRFIIGFLSVLALFVVGALIGPQFVDWEKYKPQIQTQVEKATGLSVELDSLGMSVLPMPHVTVDNLAVSSPKQKEFETLVTVKEAEVSVALLPLLQKNIQVKTVKLVDPVITLEILEDGTPSWQTEQLAPKEESSDAGEQSVASSSEAAPAVSLDKLLIKNGSLTFVDHAKKARHEVTSINTSLKADSLKGPFSGNGALVYEGKEIVFDMKAGDVSKEKAVPVRAEIKLPQSASSIAFDGVSALSMPLDVQG